MSTSDADLAWDTVKYDNEAALAEFVPSRVSANASTSNASNPVHTLLMCAAVYGARNCARHLLKHGADVHAKNFMGLAALHWAAYSGRTETLDLLLAASADVESRTDDGRTAFHVAAYRGHLRFLMEFLKAKPDLEALASNGWTALHFAVVANQRKMAVKLIELGVKEDGPDAHGDTLADLAEQYRRDWFAELRR
jgi:ankyrin repeat protein